MKVRHSLAAAGTSGPRRLRQPRKPLAVVGAVHRPVERAAAFTHPPNPFRGDPRDERVGGNIFRDDGTRGDHRVVSDPDAAHDRGVGANRRVVLHVRWRDRPLFRHRPRVHVVREDRVRADEHPVADRDAVVDRREVLELAVVPDDDVRVDVHVLPDPAVAADACILPDLCPMPDRRAVADRRGGRNFGSRVDPSGHGPDTAWRLRYETCTLWHAFRVAVAPIQVSGTKTMDQPLRIASATAGRWRVRIRARARVQKTYSSVHSACRSPLWPCSLQARPSRFSRSAWWSMGT